MKRVISLCTLVVFLCVLTACGTTTYTSEDAYFSIDLPDDITVLKAGEDPETLPQLGITKAEFTEYVEQGCVFYGEGTSDELGLTRKVTAMVMETSDSQSIWQLAGNTDDFTYFEQDQIETFNVNGITVSQSWEYDQNKYHALMLGLNTGLHDGMDAMYMATIYNGKLYSILYEADGIITQAAEEECDQIFYSFYPTKTLANPQAEAQDTTILKAVLVVVLILIGVMLVIALIRLFAHRRANREPEDNTYVPQFENDLQSSKKKKGE